MRRAVLNPQKQTARMNEIHAGCLMLRVAYLILSPPKTEPYGSEAEVWNVQRSPYVQLEYISNRHRIQPSVSLSMMDSLT